MANYFDRYSDFRYNGTMKPVVGVSIPTQNSDKTIIYKLGETRLDKISNKYYNTPYNGWLIMLANPQYGGLEFLIEDQSTIIIPFPYESAIARYIDELNKHKALYG
jgi:hypothetical protein